MHNDIPFLIYVQPISDIIVGAASDTAFFVDDRFVFVACSNTIIYLY